MSINKGDEVAPLVMTEDVLNQFTAEEQYLLRPTKSVVLNMEAVVRFHQNQQPNQVKKNPFISWTLNKIAVIDKRWLSQFHSSEVPIQDGDFWRVKIEDETSPGQPVGCFIVRPLWKVTKKDLVILVQPSTWTRVQHGLTVILYPKIRPWLPWIIPKALRQMVMRKSGGAALVIPLSYPPEGKPEGALDQTPDMQVSMPDSDHGIMSLEFNDPEIIYHRDMLDDE